MKKLENQVYIGSEGRESLYDLYWNENGNKKPIIIFCHGFKGFKDWGYFNQMAEQFALDGFAFLKFNFSFNGGTVEQPIDFPDLNAFSNNNYSKELNDLGKILDLLHADEFDFSTELDLAKVYLLGHSRGGGISILKAAQDNRIKKICTLAAVSDFSTRFSNPEMRKIWKDQGVHYIENKRTKQQMPLKYQFYEDFLKNEDLLNIPNWTKKIECPFLIVHGTDDQSVMYQEALSLKKSNPKAELLTIDGADHVFGGRHPWQQNELPKDFKLIYNHLIRFFQQ